MSKRTDETEDTDTMSEDERFVRRAAEVLSVSIGRLPPAVMARLDSIRESAVASAAPDLMNTPAKKTPVISKPGEPLPADVVERLDDIRSRAMQRAALQFAPGKQDLIAQWRERLGNVSLGLPAGAFASICVLVTTLAVLNVPSSEEPLPATLAEDVLLLASVDDIELYENLEFYQWLAENGL